MTLLKINKVLVLALGLVLTNAAHSDESTFQIKGSARVRTEIRNNKDFNDSASDSTDFTGTRFRLDLTFKPQNNLLIFFQPQYSKAWGETVFTGTSTAANTGSASSGALKDTPLDVHQAYLQYSFQSPISMLIGRKELNYGDQLLVGGVGWSNVGRSFDLMSLGFTHSIGAIEVFESKLVDQNITSSGPGDKDFAGLYSSNKICDHIQNADLYLLRLDDRTTAPFTSTMAYGLRLKSPVTKAFDYRIELTFEDVKGITTSTKDNQMDFEAGWVAHEATKTRVSAEYFTSSKNFNQLFPTGHKWLGYADLFGRRNIKGFRLGASSQVLEKLKVLFDYHQFQRTDAANSAYKLDGTSPYGTIGSDGDIGSEMDFVITYSLDQNIDVEIGAARVTPGNYVKANGGADIATFGFAQMMVSF